MFSSGDAQVAPLPFFSKGILERSSRLAHLNEGVPPDCILSTEVSKDLITATIHLLLVCLAHYLAGEE